MSKPIVESQNSTESATSTDSGGSEKNSSRIIMKERVNSQFLRSFSSVEEQSQQINDILDLEDELDIDSAISLQKILNSQNVVIIAELKKVVASIKSEQENSFLSEPLENLRRLRNITKAFKIVNHKDRNYNMSALGLNSLNSLEPEEEKIIKLISGITHDNRNFCKIIESQIIPALVKEVENIDQELLSDSYEDKIEIKDLELLKKVDILSDVIEIMERQLEKTNKVSLLEHQLIKCISQCQNILIPPGTNFSIDLDLDIKETEIPVYVDELTSNALFSVMNNLCKNSMEAGATHVGIKCHFQYDPATVSQLPMIDVIDNGPGIKKGQQILSEDRDIKTVGEQDIYGNRHEGILNAKKILECSGGSIEQMENLAEEKKGAHFRIALPTCFKDPKVTLGVSEVRDLEQSLSKDKNILIVDDEKKLTFSFIARSLGLSDSEAFKNFRRSKEGSVFVINDDYANYIFISDSIVAFNTLKKMNILNVSLDYAIIDARMPNVEGEELLQVIRDMDSFKETPIYLNSGDIIEKKHDDNTIYNGEEGKGRRLTEVSSTVARIIGNTRLESENSQIKVGLQFSRKDNMPPPTMPPRPSRETEMSFVKKVKAEKTQKETSTPLMSPRLLREEEMSFVQKVKAEKTQKETSTPFVRKAAHGEQAMALLMIVLML